MHQRENNQVYIAEKAQTCRHLFLSQVSTSVSHNTADFLLDINGTLIVRKDSLEVLPNKVSVKPFHLRNDGHSGDCSTFLKLACLIA